MSGDENTFPVLQSPRIASPYDALLCYVTAQCVEHVVLGKSSFRVGYFYLEGEFFIKREIVELCLEISEYLYIPEKECLFLHSAS